MRPQMRGERCSTKQLRPEEARCRRQHAARQRRDVATCLFAFEALRTTPLCQVLGVPKRGHGEENQEREVEPDEDGTKPLRYWHGRQPNRAGWRPITAITADARSVAAGAPLRALPHATVSDGATVPTACA